MSNEQRRVEASEACAECGEIQDHFVHDPRLKEVAVDASDYHAFQRRSVDNATAQRANPLDIVLIGGMEMTVNDLALEYERARYELMEKRADLSAPALREVIGFALYADEWLGQDARHGVTTEGVDIVKTWEIMEGVGTKSYIARAARLEPLLARLPLY